MFDPVAAGGLGLNCYAAAGAPRFSEQAVVAALSAALFRHPLEKRRTLAVIGLVLGLSGPAVSNVGQQEQQREPGVAAAVAPEFERLQTIALQDGRQTSHLSGILPGDFLIKGGPTHIGFELSALASLSQFDIHLWGTGALRPRAHILIHGETREGQWHFDIFDLSHPKTPGTLSVPAQVHRSPAGHEIIVIPIEGLPGIRAASRIAVYIETGTFDTLLPPNGTNSPIRLNPGDIPSQATVFSLKPTSTTTSSAARLVIPRAPALHKRLLIAA
jgi:hypothetical protein